MGIEPGNTPGPEGLDDQAPRLNRDTRAAAPNELSGGRGKYPRKGAGGDSHSSRGHFAYKQGVCHRRDAKFWLETGRGGGGIVHL